MIVDVNVNLSRWPARRLPYDEPQRLVEKLQAKGIKQAWTCSYDALLHQDVAAVNDRLVRDCQAYGSGLLIPFGTVNLSLPNWQDDVRRCVEYGMPGVRLFPNYHGYSLLDPSFPVFLKTATEHRLIVQVAVTMEDERTQHRLLRVPPVNVQPLISLLPRVPSCRIVLINALRAIRLDDLTAFIGAGDLSVDLATLEGAAGIEKLLQHVPQDRILFGSHFPFFYLEAALLKLRESELAGVQREAILHANAHRLLRSFG